MDIKVTYIGTPQVVPMPFSRKYMLCRPLIIKWIKDGVKHRLVIEKGYLTDGASIPSPLWPVIGSPFQPHFLGPAIVHDRMCDLSFNVEEMSEIFFQTLKLGNTSDRIAELMETAVYVYKEYINNN